MVYLIATLIVEYATTVVYVTNALEGVYVHLDLLESIAKQVIINQAIRCGEILSVF